MNLELDPDRRLALAYVARARRPALAALWDLDLAFASVLAGGSDPMISRIRLAWWRDSLEKLDRGRPPAEPLLETLARDVMTAGVTGAELASMEEGWSRLLEAGTLGPDELESHARRRGGALFRLSAVLLGDSDPGTGIAEAGEIWALVDLARHVRGEDDSAAALAAARTRRFPDSWVPGLRPLGMLASLARRDAHCGRPLEPQGAPGRMGRMLLHRLTGR